MFSPTKAQVSYIEETTEGPAIGATEDATGANGSPQASVLCKAARERRAEAAARFHDYDRLVYFVSAASAVAIIIAIGMVVIGLSGGAIATGVGGILGGAATLFLIQRRTSAKEEEAGAWGEVVEHCAGEVATLERSARVAQRFEG